MSEKGLAMPDEGRLLVSSSPHTHDKLTTRKIMLLVTAALVPSGAAGVWVFGVSGLSTLFWCVLFCVAFEFLWCLAARRPLGVVLDLSAVVTGLILGMNLAPGVPWWLCLIGSGIGVVLGKQIYGGLGHNPFNPAIVARVALLIAFPKLMTTWRPSRFMTADAGSQGLVSYDEASLNAAGVTLDAVKGKIAPLMAPVLDGVTCATPLSAAREAAKAGVSGDVFAGLAGAASYADYFWGDRGGCVGETCVFAILLGGLFLVALKIARWQTPLAMLGTVAVFTAIVHAANPASTPPPMFHLLTGGLMFGAFFCATDMVTSPMTGVGCFIFGVGCGLVTCVIRIWGGYPEGVSFAILFMNALVPLIDRFTYRLPFGYVRPVLSKEGAA